MTTHITAVTFDSTDAAAAAGFWAAVLDAPVADGATSDAASVEPREGLPLYFARVPETKTAKNRLHLDITVNDLDAEVARVAALGATVHARHGDPTGWVVMLDPDGNEFCLVAG